MEKVDSIIRFEIVNDSRVLRGIERQTGLKFDRDFKYCTDYKHYKQQGIEDPFVQGFDYKGSHYRLRFYDGCFCPYLVKMITEEVA